jgi:Tol biopolymer transport system component
VRDVQTGQATPLTKELKFGLIDGPVWSGDGRQIAFTAGSDWRVTGQSDHQLYIVNVDGSELRQVTDKNRGNATFPAWSPDGRWIAYNNGCALWIARPNGLDAQELVPGCVKFAAESIAWSPDGQQIAALNNHADLPATEIWVVNRDGRNPHRIYTHDRKGFIGFRAIAWSPDGQLIGVLYSEDNRNKTLLIPSHGGGQPQAIMGEQPWWWLSDFWPPWGTHNAVRED